MPMTSVSPPFLTPPGGNVPTGPGPVVPVITVTGGGAPLPSAVEVLMAPESLAQVTQQRVLALQGRAVELLLQLEGQLFQTSGQASPGGKSSRLFNPLTVGPGFVLGSDPAQATSPNATAETVRQIVERLAPQIARLAKISPEAARALLARYQMLAQAFPGATAEATTRLGAQTEKALSDLVTFLLRPASTPRPTQIPESLRAVISEAGGQWENLLKAAREVADTIRVGGVYSKQTQGRVPPAGVTMDGIQAGSLAPPRQSSSVASTALLTPSHTTTVEMNATQVGVNVDLVSISNQGRGLVSSLGVDVMVNVNQILSNALGTDNVLQLSSSQIEVGVQVFAGQVQQRSAASNPAAQSLAERLVDMKQTNPEGFEKLVSLLKALAKLNPQRFKGFLRQVESQLSNIVASQNQMRAAPAQLATLPAAGQGAAATGQSITVRVDVEVGQRADLIVADLRATGLGAAAVQNASITQIEVTVQIGDGAVQQGDPLIIDLADDGVDLTARETEFDLNADGQTDRSAFVKGDDALLMIDSNGDGRLTDGAELFGDQQGDSDGFSKLARYDDNADGVIDKRDAIFDKLRVVYDKNQDGITRLDEMATLKDVGIAKISLSRAAHEREDEHGNQVHERAEITREDGSTGSIYEADLTFE